MGRLFPQLYGVLTILGGVLGYVKAGSTVSLWAGCLSGLIILGCAMAARRGNMLGKALLIAMTLLLAVWFGNGFMQTGKLMPAGIMSVLSAINLLVCLRALRPAKSAENAAPSPL